MMNQSVPGPLIGVGRTAEVYNWQKDQVLKLFYDWFPAEAVQHEVRNGRVINALSLPTPKLFGTIQIGNRQGIIYERAAGPSMLKLINAKPWLVGRLARQLAELQTEIHQQSGQGLDPFRPALVHSIQSADGLPADLKHQTLQLLEELPDGDRLCHFDFHPDQVICAAQGPLILDWMTALQGAPLADVARTAVLLSVGQVPYGSWLTRAVIGLWRGLFLRTWLARYLELHPGVTRRDVERWMIPVATERLTERIPGERDLLLKLIQSYLARQSSN